MAPEQVKKNTYNKFRIGYARTYVCHVRAALYLTERPVPDPVRTSGGSSD